MPHCSTRCAPVAEALGAAPGPAGLSVAIPAPGATALWLCLFEGEEEVARHRLIPGADEVFRGLIPHVGEGARYGLRAEGPASLGRFNPAKLLLDPWARALDRPQPFHASQFDTGHVPSAEDSAPHMAKAVVTAPLPPLDWAPLPPRPQVIYEAHVRGLTMRHPEVPAEIRGTFAALAHPAVIAHLQGLGVTHLELLPCAAWADERHLPALGLTNYWGYNPVAFLAPDPRLAPGGMAEVRAAVSALRAAGIGVLLDVVFNHTAESDAQGATLSLRGLGEAHWYRAGANQSGCGNVLALDRPWPLRLVMDALRHWAEGAGVDGFRLDLATTLGRREGHGFDPHAPLLAAMRQDPVLRTRRIIAEPWDMSDHSLGAFPPGWGEWNDSFRDDVRRFWRGDAGMTGRLATRLAGSSDLLPGRPGDSVNFVTAHDGFTLADLVSHAGRHNLANGEFNRDGTADNLSWNHGVEGPTDDAAIRARRANDARALLATLLLARGVPMLAMGDELGRGQGGNNNAYCQDNDISWLDWAKGDTALRDFTARLIAARHAHPALHATAPLTGEAQEGFRDVAWLTLAGEPLEGAAWDRARSLMVALHHEGDRVVVLLHRDEAAAVAHLPLPRWGHRWRLLADSAEPARAGDAASPLSIAPRSVVLLVEESRPARQAEAPEPALLGRLAEAAGLAPIWHDVEGRRHLVPEGTLRALLGALGLPAETAAQAHDSLARRMAAPLLPPHVAGVTGQPTRLKVGTARRLTLALHLEGGERRELALLPQDGVVTLPPLPSGRHRLEHGTALCHLTIAPAQAVSPPPGRHFGATAQIYALRHARDQGLGDFTAVAELARALGVEGALWLGLSPPHALHLMDRARASPYQPSDRRFLEPFLIDVARLPSAQGRAWPAASHQVDYDAAWAAKRAVLAAEWARGGATDPQFQEFRRAGGGALEDFATYGALAEHHGHGDPARWGAGLAHAHDRGVADFAARHADAIGFHAFLQFLADRQLAEAARGGAGLYRDLAVGSAPDGAEAWCRALPTLRGFSMGAPPDPLGPHGQVWGVPPPDPVASMEEGHAGFADLIHANMRHAAALRIDHVLGLKRLFLVPDGAPASEGCYLAQDLPGLLGEIRLESHRAGCAVVGEDLGTVPEGLREALGEAGLLSYRVLWFEREGQRFTPPARWPEAAVACVATHDVPTLAGWWEGEDIREREALGLFDAAAARAARAERAAERTQLLDALAASGHPLPAGAADGPFTPDIAAAIHGHVAATPSAVLLVQAEDLAGERVAVNLPGTDRQRPNWRLRLSEDAAGLTATPVGRAILDAVRRERGASPAA
nr:glycogen debranching protein GlgX [Roseococcus suduntuyensis]